MGAGHARRVPSGGAGAGFGARVRLRLEGEREGEREGEGERGRGREREGERPWMGREKAKEWRTRRGSSCDRRLTSPGDRGRDARETQHLSRVDAGLRYCPPIDDPQVPAQSPRRWPPRRPFLVSALCQVQQLLPIPLPIPRCCPVSPLPCSTTVASASPTYSPTYLALPTADPRAVHNLLTEPLATVHHPRPPWAPRAAGRHCTRA
jgi:hypothetical protein